MIHRSLLLVSAALASVAAQCATDMQVSVRFTDDIYCVDTAPCSGVYLPSKTGCPTKGTVSINTKNTLQVDTCCSVIDTSNAVGCVIPVAGSTECIGAPNSAPSSTSSAPVTTDPATTTPATTSADGIIPATTIPATTSADGIIPATTTPATTIPATASADAITSAVSTSLAPATNNTPTSSTTKPITPAIPTPSSTSSSVAANTTDSNATKSPDAPRDSITEPPSSTGNATTNTTVPPSTSATSALPVIVSSLVVAIVATML
ncbi:hypothetical protein H257_13733 [Aphanomyces astaci]|uniref:Uncharacterized protein n=1 Tax=Aphanomyces astaci TaxID=112090 RepID=W4FU66_APHAT|nr:hypothetical protein H257_13733 [Aphanomyces astaci]ETV71007.1 hypothetical protein H257_13733 [Aphanomyces astaci]|eukprot:XP_009839670.1 hypothetical protein H257_13733 [Aphanomyces astaci]